MFLSVYPSPCLVLDFGTSDVIMPANKALTAATVDCEWKKQIHTHINTLIMTHTHPTIKTAASHIAQDTDTSTRGRGGGLYDCAGRGDLYFNNFNCFLMFLNCVFSIVLIVMGVGCRGGRVGGRARVQRLQTQGFGYQIATAAVIDIPCYRTAGSLTLKCEISNEF